MGQRKGRINENTLAITNETQVKKEVRERKEEERDNEEGGKGAKFSARQYKSADREPAQKRRCDVKDGGRSPSHLVLVVRASFQWIEWLKFVQTTYFKLHPSGDS